MVDQVPEARSRDQAAAAVGVSGAVFRLFSKPLRLTCFPPVESTQKRLPCLPYRPTVAIGS